jgi:hypothetical protein
MRRLEVPLNHRTLFATGDIVSCDFHRVRMALTYYRTLLD